MVEVESFLWLAFLEQVCPWGAFLWSHCHNDLCRGGSQGRQSLTREGDLEQEKKGKLKLEG